jgi:hypothetical protein
MVMMEFYAQIKWVHVAAVLSSGTLFLVRGLLVYGYIISVARAHHPLGILATF